MAAHLSLRHKETGAIFTGSDLIKVDEMLCAALGVQPDPVSWHMGWMDWIGFCLAYRSDRAVADILGEMAPNVRANERALVDWFILTFENASYHGR